MATKKGLGLLELLREEKWDPGAIGYLQRGIQKAIYKSFLAEPLKRGDITLETRRRTLLAMDIYKIASNDLKWSARRCADRLEVLLLRKIRGEEIFPLVEQARSAWFGPGNLEGGENGNVERESGRTSGDPQILDQRGRRLRGE